MVKAKSLTVATMLGVVAFLSNGLLPTPLDKMLIVFQGIALALASLSINEGWGGIYASAVNGFLLTIIRAGFFPFSLFFSLVYGLLIDLSIRIFKVRMGSQVKTYRMIGALTLSTTITGLMSLFVTTFIGIMTMAFVLYMAIFIIGILNGIAAGFLSAILWNKHLRHPLMSILEPNERHPR